MGQKEKHSSKKYETALHANILLGQEYTFLLEEEICKAWKADITKRSIVKSRYLVEIKKNIESQRTKIVARGRTSSVKRSFLFESGQEEIILSAGADWSMGTHSCAVHIRNARTHAPFSSTRYKNFANFLFFSLPRSLFRTVKAIHQSPCDN